MKEKSRFGLAWIVSFLAHALILILVFPNAGGAKGEGMRIMEVGLVEMPAVAQRAAPAARPAPAVKTQPAETRRREPVPEKAGQDASHPREAASRQTAPVPVPPPAGPSAGGSPGQGSGEGFGTGEGLVLSRPVSFPKSAQNEGVEGIVRLAVFLPPAGSVRAKIVESSGDQRLDTYSLRVVTEAWRYKAPPTGVRIAVTLIYRQGQVEVLFERSEPWAGEGFER